MLHCSISMFPFFEEDVDPGKWSTYIQQVVGEKLFFFFLYSELFFALASWISGIGNEN